MNSLCLSVSTLYSCCVLNCFVYSMFPSLFLNNVTAYLRPLVTQVSGLPLVSHYEEVNFKGWFGLLLAVQQQPVVVNIDASGNEFQGWKVNTHGPPQIFNSCVCCNSGLCDPFYSFMYCRVATKWFLTCFCCTIFRFVL